MESNVKERRLENVRQYGVTGVFEKDLLYRIQ
jgi:hypothetical protein